MMAGTIRWVGCPSIGQNSTNPVPSFSSIPRTLSHGFLYVHASYGHRSDQHTLIVPLPISIPVGFHSDHLQDLYRKPVFGMVMVLTKTVICCRKKIKVFIWVGYSTIPFIQEVYYCGYKFLSWIHIIFLTLVLVWYKYNKILLIVR